MDNLHFVVCEAVKAVRQRLANADQSYFKLEIDAAGRVQEGDVKITYSLSDSIYGSNKVDGSSIEAVTTEFLRRKGWSERHAPLELEAPRTLELTAVNEPF